MATIRQLLAEQIAARLALIRTGSGYFTDAGLQVACWRVHPWTIEETEDNPGINFKDTSETIAPQVGGVWDRRLTVVIEGVASSTGSGAEATARELLADIKAAVGTDRLWTYGEIKLARDTVFETEEIEVQEQEHRVAVVKLVMVVAYRTAQFNDTTNI